MGDFFKCVSPFEFYDIGATFRRSLGVKYLIFHIEALFDLCSTSTTRDDLGSGSSPITSFISTHVFIRPHARELLQMAKLTGKKLILASTETYTTPILELFGLKEFFNYQVICRRDRIVDALRDAHNIREPELLLFDHSGGDRFKGAWINVGEKRGGINVGRVWSDYVLGNYSLPTELTLD
jgi:hypothetical protein